MTRMRDDLSVLVDAEGNPLTDDQQKADLLCDVFEQTYRSAIPCSSGRAVLCPKDIPYIDDVGFLKLPLETNDEVIDT